MTEHFPPILAVAGTTVMALIAAIAAIVHGLSGIKSTSIEHEGLLSVAKETGKQGKEAQASEQKALMALKERESESQREERAFQTQQRELLVGEGRERAEFDRGTAAMQIESAENIAAKQALAQRLSTPTPDFPTRAAPQRINPGGTFDLKALLQLLRQD